MALSSWRRRSSYGNSTDENTTAPNTRYNRYPNTRDAKYHVDLWLCINRTHELLARDWSIFKTTTVIRYWLYEDNNNLTLLTEPSHVLLCCRNISFTEGCCQRQSSSGDSLPPPRNLLWHLRRSGVLGNITTKRWEEQYFDYRSWLISCDRLLVGVVIEFALTFKYKCKKTWQYKN